MLQDTLTIITKVSNIYFLHLEWMLDIIVVLEIHIEHELISDHTDLEILDLANSCDTK